MAVGVTTFIAGSLASGKRFSIGGKLASGKGLSIGRTTDMLVRRAHKGQRLSTHKKSHKRALDFFRLLAEHGLTLSEVQVRAIDDALGIKTEIDALAVTTAGQTVGIELKTTQHTMASFSAAYYTVCRNKSTLTNGLPNCLYWRHQLQAGFAVVAGKCTRAVVMVMCEDGGLMYEVVPTATDRAMFAGSTGTAAVRLRAPLLDYPTDADDTLRSTLKRRLKYTKVLRHNPTIVSGSHGDAVLLLVHKSENYAKTAAAKGHREYARIMSRKHHMAVVIGWLAKGCWRFETVVRRPRTV